MKDYREIIKRLKQENERIDTTDAQKESNEWRIKWYELMNRPKNTDTTYIRLDPVKERLANDAFTCTPRHFLAD